MNIDLFKNLTTAPLLLSLLLYCNACDLRKNWEKAYSQCNANKEIIKQMDNPFGADPHSKELYSMVTDADCESIKTICQADPDGENCSKVSAAFPAPKH